MTSWNIREGSMITWLAANYLETISPNSPKSDWCIPWLVSCYTNRTGAYDLCKWWQNVPKQKTYSCITQGYDTCRSTWHKPRDISRGRISARDHVMGYAPHWSRDCSHSHMTGGRISCVPKPYFKFRVSAKRTFQFHFIQISADTEYIDAKCTTDRKPVGSSQLNWAYTNEFQAQHFTVRPDMGWFLWHQEPSVMHTLHWHMTKLWMNGTHRV